MAIVELVPAAGRPYVGGSQTNSVLELIFGYNGFGRLTCNEPGSIGGPPGGGGPDSGDSAFGGGGFTQLVSPSWGGADVAAALLPLVEDTGWFFDTELLVLAERTGLRIHEVPVDWVDAQTAASISLPPHWPTCTASSDSAACSPPEDCRWRRCVPSSAGRH